MSRKLALVAVLLAANASACLNDRDTEIREAQSPPEVLRALTGAFVRYPPAYYQDRVALLRAKKSLAPRELDDLAVALDRLGRDAEALRVIERKFSLPRLTKEDRYRLYANRGTFRAHLAINRNDVQGLRSAAQDIAKAIEIKPDAHFGREGIQLRVLRWLIAYRTAGEGVIRGRGAGDWKSLGVTLSEQTFTEEARQIVARSLAGLIELGGAWESPDVVAAIGVLTRGVFEADDTAPITGRIVLDRAALYARLRYDELLGAGRHPIASNAEEFLGRLQGTPEERTIASDFRRECAAAEDANRARADYIVRRLSAGHRPDTDSTFWSGWHEPAPTIHEVLRPRVIPRRASGLAQAVPLILAGLGVALLALAVGIAAVTGKLARRLFSR